MYMLYNITVDWYGATASQHRSDIGSAKGVGGATLALFEYIYIIYYLREVVQVWQLQKHRQRQQPNIKQSTRKQQKHTKRDHMHGDILNSMQIMKDLTNWRSLYISDEKN